MDISKFIPLNKYKEMHQESITNGFEDFWQKQMDTFHWHTKYDKVHDKSAYPIAKWFTNGKISPSYNMFDARIKGKEDVVVFSEYDFIQDKIIRTKTLGEVFEEIKQLAYLLRQNGIKKGDVVGVYSTSIAESFVFIHACIRIGAVAHGIFENFSGEEIKKRLLKIKTKAILACSGRYVGNEIVSMANNLKAALVRDTNSNINTSSTNSLEDNIDNVNLESENLDNLNVKVFLYQCDYYTATDVPKDWVILNDALLEINKTKYEDLYEIVDSDHPLSILQTSGSTGEPKFIYHSVTSVLIMAYNLGNYLFPEGVRYRRKQNKIMYQLNPSWITGHINLCYSLPLALDQYVLFRGNPFIKGLDSYWGFIEKHQINVTGLYASAVNTIKTLDPEGKTTKKFDLSNFDIFYCGGDILDALSEKWLLNIFPEHTLVCNIYGQTEAANFLTTLLFRDEKLNRHGSSNLPVLGTDIRVLEEKIVIREPFPPTFCAGFWNDYGGKQTDFINKYFTKEKELDSEKNTEKEVYYYHTGDYGKFEEDGYLHVLGRDEECLKAGLIGMKVAAGEMENIINHHSKIALSFATEVRVNYVYKLAVVVQRSLFSKPEDEPEIKAFVEEQMEKKFCEKNIVHEVIFVKDFPRNFNGKVLRGLMKKIINNQEFAIPSNIVSKDPVEELLRLVKKV